MEEDTDGGWMDGWIRQSRVVRWMKMPYFMHGRHYVQSVSGGVAETINFAFERCGREEARR